MTTIKTTPVASRAVAAANEAAGEAGEDSIAADELRNISEAINREYPLLEQPAGIVLMEVDPYRLHVYWQLDDEVIQSAADAFGGAGELILRFRELPDQDRPSGGMLTVFDRAVASTSGHMEVGAPDPGRSYRAELGLAADDGGWKSLAKSESVRLPAAAPPRRRTADTLNLKPALPDGQLPAEKAGAIPPADPSLRGGAEDALTPEFPVTEYIVEKDRPASDTNQTVQPDVPEVDDSVPLPPAIPDYAAS